MADEILEKLNTLQSGVDELKTGQEDLSSRLGQVEDGLGAVEDRLGGVEGGLVGVEAAIARVDERTQANYKLLVAIQRSTNDAVQLLTERIDRATG